MDKLTRAEDAELENKDGKPLLVRFGPLAREALERAAARTGMGIGPYLRRAGVKQAIEDLKDA